MSNIEIKDKYLTEYYKAMDKYVNAGTTTESTVEMAMKNLLDNIAKDYDMFLTKPNIKKGKKHSVIYDGVIQTVNGWQFGYYEAKDSKDNLYEY